MTRRATLRLAGTVALLAALVLPASAALTRLARADFDRQTSLDQPIQTGGLDAALLAAAIFHETNRVREQLGLKRFRPHEQLDDAAETQATIGALFRPPSHTNPFPFISTPLDRVKQAGLTPGQVAENIALIPIYNIPHGTGFFQYKGDSRYRDVRTGEVLKLHTYRTFAAVIVQA